MRILQTLFHGLSESAKHSDFVHLIEACIKAFQEHGVDVHRMQVPMNKFSGLRHPKYAVIILTYNQGNVDIVLRSHEQTENLIQRNSDYLLKTPYGEVIGEKNTYYQHALQGEEFPYELFYDLKKAGFTDYISASAELPLGRPQVFSIATQNANGFPDHAQDVLNNFYLPFATCLFAVYQSNVTKSLSSTYLGIRTGNRVLQGEIYRGLQDTIEAGIMFCDVRGFTAMSETLGASEVVKVMNDIFQVIEDEISEYQGEILKFIGDALLIIFPRAEYRDDQQLGEVMIKSALSAVEKVEELGKKKGLPLSVGFGCHIGDVLYGNIGTENRLDFTVMGPSVNLTSRLESMCKPLNAILTVSTKVSSGNEMYLKSLGHHSVKGITNPIEIWGVESSM